MTPAPPPGARPGAASLAGFAGVASLGPGDPRRAADPRPLPSALCFAVSRSLLLTCLVPAALLGLRYYYSRKVIRAYLECALHTDMADIEQYYMKPPGESRSCRSPTSAPDSPRGHALQQPQGRPGRGPAWVGLSRGPCDLSLLGDRGLRCQRGWGRHSRLLPLSDLSRPCDAVAPPFPAVDASPWRLLRWGKGRWALWVPSGVPCGDGVACSARVLGGEGLCGRGRGPYWGTEDGVGAGDLTLSLGLHFWPDRWAA